MFESEFVVNNRFQCDGVLKKRPSFNPSALLEGRTIVEGVPWGWEPIEIQLNGSTETFIKFFDKPPRAFSIFPNDSTEHFRVHGPSVIGSDEGWLKLSFTMVELKHR
tara:strand:+ start:212 stop:532 length:321 start_codon:yes stop_codon:yes gene_type:complete